MIICTLTTVALTRIALYRPACKCSFVTIHEENLDRQLQRGNNTDLVFDIWPTPDAVDTRYFPNPGPLTISALSIFGNQTFFYTAANSSTSTVASALAQICQQRNIPFAQLFQDLDFFAYDPVQCNHSNEPYYPVPEEGLLRILYSWICGFYTLRTAEQALETATFFANEALLIETASETIGYKARPISTSPGLMILKPHKSPTGTMIISFLILLQFIGLIFLARYAYQVPTWTDALDAIAVARIGANLKDLPPIGKINEGDLKKELENVDALVGVAVDEERKQIRHYLNIADEFTLGSEGLATEDVIPLAPVPTRYPTPRTSGFGPKMGRLEPSATRDLYKIGLGAPGLITRKHAPPRKEKRRNQKKERRLSV